MHDTLDELVHAAMLSTPNTQFRVGLHVPLYFFFQFQEVTTAQKVKTKINSYMQHISN